MLTGEQAANAYFRRSAERAVVAETRSGHWHTVQTSSCLYFHHQWQRQEEEGRERGEERLRIAADTLTLLRHSGLPTISPPLAACQRPTAAKRQMMMMLIDGVNAPANSQCTPATLERLPLAIVRRSSAAATASEHLRQLMIVWLTCLLSVISCNSCPVQRSSMCLP